MDERSINRASGLLFGGMTLFITAILVVFRLKRPDLYELGMENIPVLIYATVGLLGVAWLVTLGLFLGHYWARAVAGIYAGYLLLTDYFEAARMISGPALSNDPEIALTHLRLATMGFVLVAVWSVSLLYLFLHPRPVSGSSPSTLSVEVLNTK